MASALFPTWIESGSMVRVAIEDKCLTVIDLQAHVDEVLHDWRGADGNVNEAERQVAHQGGEGN